MAAEIDRTRAALIALYGIASRPDAILVNDGDSTSSGAGSILNDTALRRALPLLGRPVTAYVAALFGDSMAHRASAVARTIAPLYDPAARPFIVHILAGTNDIRGGADAAAIYAALQAYVKAVHALGPNAKVIVGTEPLQCDILHNPARRAVLQTYDDLIRTKWNTSPQTGGLGADGLADYQADARIDAADYTASAFCMKANSPDGQHPSDEFMTVFAEIEAQAVARLLP